MAHFAWRPFRELAETICLLGGYGDVGVRLAHLLHDNTQCRILLAGRDGQRAQTAAVSVGERCLGMTLDARTPDAAARLAGVSLCVNLTEATPPALATRLVTGGTHFIDSSASPAYVADLRRAIGAVPVPRASGVVETGLAPGLTNLLASHMCQTHPDTRSIDILIELGMGAHHGVAATEWTLRALTQIYPMKSGGQWQDIQTGVISRSFTSAKGPILGIGFAFSDQGSIARDLNLDGARTFLAIDPGWMTRLMRWLSRSPLRNLLVAKARPLARAMQYLPGMGGNGTRLTLEGRDAQGALIATDRLSGGPQADMTAAVIALAVLELLKPDSAVKNGLQTLDKLLDPASASDNRYAITNTGL